MNNYDNEDVLERIRSALRSSTNREERKKLEEAVCFNPFSFQHFSIKTFFHLLFSSLIPLFIFFEQILFSFGCTRNA